MKKKDPDQSRKEREEEDELKQIQDRALDRAPRSGSYTKLSPAEKRLYNKTVREYRKHYEMTPEVESLIHDIGFTTVQIRKLEESDIQNECRARQLSSYRRQRRASIRLLTTMTSSKRTSKKKRDSLVAIDALRDDLRASVGLPPSCYRYAGENGLEKGGKQRRKHDDGITRTQ